MLSKEEILKMLRESGMSEGSWGERKAKAFGIPEVITDSKKLLGTMKHLMERQIETDQKAIADAYVALNRLEHGGGC